MNAPVSPPFVQSQPPFSTIDLDAPCKLDAFIHHRDSLPVPRHWKNRVAGEPGSKTAYLRLGLRPPGRPPEGGRSQVARRVAAGPEVSGFRHPAADVLATRT